MNSNLSHYFFSRHPYWRLVFHGWKCRVKNSIIFHLVQSAIILWIRISRGRLDVSLHCDERGSFEPLQCDLGRCWCVEEDSGIPRTRPIIENLAYLLPCYEEETFGARYKCYTFFFFIRSVQFKFLLLVATFGSASPEPMPEVRVPSWWQDTVTIGLGLLTSIATTTEASGRYTATRLQVKKQCGSKKPFNHRTFLLWNKIGQCKCVDKYNNLINNYFTSNIYEGEMDCQCARDEMMEYTQLTCSPSVGKNIRYNNIIWSSFSANSHSVTFFFTW